MNDMPRWERLIHRIADEDVLAPADAVLLTIVVALLVVVVLCFFYLLLALAFHS